MSIEENKAIIRRYTEACNKKDLALLEELVSPDYFHSTLQLRGWEEYKQLETMIWKAFPDLHETNEDFIAEGDRVCYRIKLTGTHTDEWEFFGITFAPTGKKLTWTAVNIFRIVDGKIVERKSVRDVLDFLKQLGAIEPTEKGKKFFPESAT